MLDLVAFFARYRLEARGVIHVGAYEGCALADELDTSLAERGFRRVATACHDHPSWGDALYLRPALAQVAEGEADAGTDP